MAARGCVFKVGSWMGCASVQILGGVGWLCDGVGGGIGLLRMIS